MTDRLMSPKQVAETLGISVATLYRLWENGDGPRRLRVSPQRVFVRVSDLEAFIQERVECFPCASQSGKLGSKERLS